MTVADVLLWFFGWIMAVVISLFLAAGLVVVFFGRLVDWWERRQEPEPFLSDRELDRRIEDGRIKDAWTWKP